MIEPKGIEKMLNDMNTKSAKGIRESHCFDMLRWLLHGIEDDYFNINYLADGVTCDVRYCGDVYELTIKPKKEESDEIQK